MGFGSACAVRRLKYEKVDRVEQIGSFRKYPIYPMRSSAKKIGGKKSRTKIIPTLYLRYCWDMLDDCIFDNGNSKTFKNLFPKNFLK